MNATQKRRARMKAAATPEQLFGRVPPEPTLDEPCFDVSPEERHHMIESAAYYLAQKRGFAAGFELDDWVRAEREIDAALAMREPPDVDD